jgi:hypothetical protein
MATYTEPSDPSTLSPHALATELRRLIAAADGFFFNIPAETAAHPLFPDKWSIQQTVGHLIDSAANNIQRVVRLQLAPELTLPGYQQNEWINVQHYDLESWDELRTLLVALNRHLAHIIEHADASAFTHVWHYSEGDLTLGFIIEDYIAHLRHHLVKLPGFNA